MAERRDVDPRQVEVMVEFIVVLLCLGYPTSSRVFDMTTS